MGSHPMQPSPPPPGFRRALRRFGPLVAIVVLLASVEVTVALTGSNGGTSSGSVATRRAAPGSFQPAGVLSWGQAAATGQTRSIDWGARCDTSRGKLAYPSFFAGDCYAPFHGTNGGVTTPGVTGDSIKVVLYQAQDQDPILKYIEGAIGDTDTNAQTLQTVRDWVNFYQSFYETYGRKVDLVPFTATGAANDEVAARADATRIIDDIKPFMVIGGPVLTNAFGDELANNKIMCIDCVQGQPNAYYAQHAPYMLGLMMNPDEGQIHLAEYVGKALANRKAQYAGSSGLQNERRKFGEIYLSADPNSPVQQAHFEQSLAHYGVHLATVLDYKSPLDLGTDARALIAQLKSAGVTSVLFVGDPIAPGPLTRAAASQDYDPEWVITGTALIDTTVFARTYDQRQWAHAFGISFLPARTDPSVSGLVPLYEWFYGHAPPSKTGGQLVAADFNLLYAILQGVGPDLTPQTFEDAAFAAPPTPTAFTQPSISFGNHGRWPFTDYLGIDDATQIWWNPAAKGPDELGTQGSGMYEYADGGKRYLPGHWPATPPDVFDPKGAVTIYTTVPPLERVPAYPSPAGRH